MTYIDALAVLAERLDGLAAPWVVSGSAAMALHGFPVSPADIDIESTGPGAREISDRLAAYVVRPVVASGTEKIRSHFGTFRLCGTVVEVMGDMEIYTDGRWSAPFLAGVGAVWLPTPVGPLPVASVAALADQYDRLGRVDRVRMLREKAWS